jgi:hypothetical protein
LLANSAAGYDPYLIEGIHATARVSHWRSDGALPSQPPDAPGRFSLSDPVRVRDILGLTTVTLHGLHQPMRFGEDVDSAFDSAIWPVATNRA